jgi:hypothetical protein
VLARVERGDGDLGWVLPGVQTSTSSTSSRVRSRFQSVSTVRQPNF